MLKYVSLMAVVAALVWTWILSNSQPEISIDTHASIQREVEDLIRKYIRDHRPTATNVEFYQLYTKTMSPTKVKAFFKYSFDDNTGTDDDTRQMFEGQATLNKDAKSTPDESVWTLDEVTANNTSIEYQKGLEVHGGAHGDSQ